MKRTDDELLAELLTRGRELLAIDRERFEGLLELVEATILAARGWCKVERALALPEVN